MHQQQQTNILQIFCNMHEKMFTKSLLFYMGCFLLSVLWYDFVNKQIFPVICYNHKLLSHLKLDFKQRLTMVHVRFENCRVSLSFGWGIFINVMGLDLSCASEKI